MAKAKSSKPKRTAPLAVVSSASSIAAGSYRRQAEEAHRLIAAGNVAVRCAADATRSIRNAAASNPAAAAIFAEFGLGNETLENFDDLSAKLLNAFPAA